MNYKNPSLISTYILNLTFLNDYERRGFISYWETKLDNFAKIATMYSKLQKCAWINHNIWYAGRDNRDSYKYRRIIISEIVWVFPFPFKHEHFLFLLRTFSNRILYTLIKIYTIKNMLSPLLHERSGEVEATTSNIIWVIT